MMKIEALAKFLECETDDLGHDPSGDSAWRYAGGEYLVLTDEEADERTRESITESLWAFRPEFLANAIGLPDCAEMIGAYAEKKCEDANPAILQLVGDRLDFVIYDAVSSDGRGHFLAAYDNEENESGEFFIYRTN